MAMDKDDYCPLFEKDVKIAIKRNGSQRDARLRIFVGFGQDSSLNLKKELHVRLTDESDPFFLQFIYLGEEDFQRLKEQQGLLVEFSAFPQKFIDLIEQCINDEKSSSPRFLLQFTSNGSTLHSNGQLDVVETNPFKHLIHLSLKFLPANDEEIKKYLAASIKSLKDLKAALEEKIYKLENSYSTNYSALAKQLDEKSKELDDLKSQWMVKLNELSSRHYDEMNLTKQQEMKLQNDCEEKIRSHCTEWEEKYKNTVDKLEQRNMEKDSINKDLMDKKYKAESAIREIKNRNAHLEEECRRTNKELQFIRRQNSNLDSDRHERDKTLNHLRTRVAVLEQELKDKEAIISRSNELLETSSNQKKCFEDELRQKGIQMHKLEGTVKSVSDEVIKGNEIIKKLQNDIRTLKYKGDLKNLVTTKQERIIEEKEQVLLSQKRSIDEQATKLSEKEQELHKLTDELQITKQKVEENQDLVKTNENVINWLNKQLNDQMLGGQNRCTPSTDTIGSLSNAAGSLSNAGKLPSARFALQHHSTPSSGYVSASVPLPNTSSFHQIPNQVLYRPPRRAPSAWQSPPSTTAGSLRTTINGQSDQRQPLRQVMPRNRPIIEQSEPAVDMKYLQMNARGSAQNRCEAYPENDENNAENSSQKRGDVRAFPVAKIIQKEAQS